MPPPKYVCHDVLIPVMAYVQGKRQAYPKRFEILAPVDANHQQLTEAFHVLHSEWKLVGNLMRIEHEIQYHSA